MVTFSGHLSPFVKSVQAENAHPWAPADKSHGIKAFKANQM